MPNHPVINNHRRIGTTRLIFSGCFAIVVFVFRTRPFNVEDRTSLVWAMTYLIEREGGLNVQGIGNWWNVIGYYLMEGVLVGEHLRIS